jgi:hypothetical protein
MSRRTDRVEPQAAPAPPAESRVQQDAARSSARDTAPGGPAVSAYIDSPERFLDRIAELRKEGRHNEAEQLLAEFRQRYPDYRISKEMLEKVERKK